MYRRASLTRHERASTVRIVFAQIGCSIRAGSDTAGQHVQYLFNAGRYRQTSVADGLLHEGKVHVARQVRQAWFMKDIDKFMLLKRLWRTSSRVPQELGRSTYANGVTEEPGIAVIDEQGGAVRRATAATVG